MFLKIIREINKGKGIGRTLMNIELSHYTLKGKILDVGGGNQPSYLRFLKDDGFELVNIDNHKGEKSVRVNLEKDKLPYEDNSIDQVLILNVLEHIYNYKYVLSEIKRVLKPGGRIIGFVPFSIGYHPDPHDFFRYTQEALEKIFKEIDFQEIKIKGIGLGPFAISFDTTSFIFPNFLRALVFSFCYFFDLVILKLRPNFKKKFSSGYFFLLTK